MKYIRHFDTHAEHEEKRSELESLGIYLSYCEDNKDTVLWRKYKEQLPNPYKDNPYVNQYLTIQANEANTEIFFTVYNSKSNSYFTKLEYSLDTENWDEMQFPEDGGSATQFSVMLTERYSKLYLRGTAREDELKYTGYQIPRSLNIKMNSGRCDIYGNIMSLVYGDDFEDKTLFKTDDFKGFYYLFSRSEDLIDALNLLLPAMKLTDNCYNNMFSFCSKLAFAPELPATEIAAGCYMYMFQNCSSLADTTPELPAEELKQSCYANMFQGCSHLNIGRRLPAMKLANSCYTNMFNGCTKLEIAPELPAEELVYQCYASMFSGCRSLVSAIMLAINIPEGERCLSNWLNNVGSGGTLKLNVNRTFSLPTGPDGIPEGWTIEEVE